MANKFLNQFPAKTTPVLADIVYVGDSANSFTEVKSTFGQFVTNNNVVQFTGSLTTGDVATFTGTNNVKDSGVNIDSSQNITNVTSITLTQDPTANLQVATKQYADTKLAKSQNLGDLSSASAARDNLGLGTAATKTASNNADANVASVQGVITPGDLAIFADSKGTIIDGGPVPTGQFLVKTNNLSDVSNATVSFNNISPLTTAGDTINFDGTNNIRLAGSASDGYVYTYDSTRPGKIKWAAIPSPGELIRVINSATILTSADFGKTIICQGSSSYSVVLPAAGSGINQFIYIVIDTGSNALVTVSVASGILEGQTSIVYGSGDTVSVMTDGTEYLIFDQHLVTVDVRYGLSNTQSSSGNILFNSLIKDDYSYYNTGTGIFTPLYPGIYKMKATVTSIVTLTATNNNNVIQLVASTGTTSSNFYMNINSAGQTISHDRTVTFNGSTNTANFQWLPQGTTATIGGAVAQNYLEIFRSAAF